MIVATTVDPQDLGAGLDLDRCSDETVVERPDLDRLPLAGYVGSGAGSWPAGGEVVVGSGGRVAGAASATP